VCHSLPLRQLRVLDLEYPGPTLSYLILTLNSNSLGIGVRCGRVKVVSSSIGYVCMYAELRMPTRKGRVPGLPVV